ncbi:MAG: hypothetical protein HZB54_00105 [Deltaproteobacteria bacterium]|nr:hypothetical protein [Deltaproteobacteria bacterium]
MFLHLTIINIFAEDMASAKKDGEETTRKRVSLEYEIDAYYSNIGLYISLTDQPIPDAGEKEELEIYKDLLFSSYIPRFLVLEAAVFPMPNLGVYLKEDAGDLYKEANISENLNLVKAITAGFDEPYAFSVFLGNVVSFTRPGEKWKQGNFGYMGYLISVGDYHIKDNDLIKDNWCELEWKIKGDRKFSTHDLHWSFRVGGKLHDNADIKNAIYLSLRRSRLDLEESGSILKNSGFEYTFDMDMKTLDPLRHYLVVDKKWPFKGPKIAFSLAVGFIWEAAKRYTGSLRSKGDGDDFQIIIRPNILF